MGGIRQEETGARGCGEQDRRRRADGSLFAAKAKPDGYTLFLAQAGPNIIIPLTARARTTASTASTTSPASWSPTAPWS
ncbi:MAG: hypothetical protein ACLRWP_11225 [Bilophila wadsworthia]